MAINPAIREAETALEEIRKEHTGTFDAIVFHLVAELVQYEKLRQNKLPAKMMEKRWEGVTRLFIDLAKDWQTMKALDEDMMASLENNSRNGGLTL